MRSIAKLVKQFKQDWTNELSAESIAAVCRDCGMNWINSLLNPAVTIQLFLLQVLHGNTACTELPHLSRMSFSAAAYCKARMRLPLAVFKQLLKQCFLSMGDGGEWLGHQVFFVDGSSFSMPDTPALQSHFGQPGNQKAGCGFPVAHWLVKMDMSTGMITGMLASAMRTHDMKRVAELHPELQKDDVLVADRGFCSYPHLSMLIERGVHAVLRIHQQTIVDFTPERPHATPGRGKGSTRKGKPRSRWLRRLGVEDQVVQWLKHPNSKPVWMSDEQFASLPEELTVRELRYSVHRNGFRAKQVTLVTTLLEDTVYPKEELAKLYRMRWQIETNIRHLKTTMGMEILKCKTVDGVLRELHMFALAYNLIRQVMLHAAIDQNVETNEISFIDALRWLRSAHQGDQLSRLVALPKRPDRIEPRVKKRRPKNYRLMIKPRPILIQELLNK